MKSSPLLLNGALLLVALLWGFGFIPQRLGLETLEPMAFNAWRFCFGALTLLPILFLLRHKINELLNRQVFFAGLVLGILLTAAAGFQQISLGMTKVANVAFITGFNVIFVPIIGLFFNHRYTILTWSGGVLALIGLGLLSGFQLDLFTAGSITEELIGDGYALIGAFFWALHLLAINYFVDRYNQYALAFFQFFFCALLSLIANLVYEPTLFASDSSGYIWALINGVIVVGIAYTLQVLALKHAEPFVASVIFSLESVFGALAGYWFFHEILGFSGLIGAGLMLVGCLLAQSPEKRDLKRKRPEKKDA